MVPIHKKVFKNSSTCLKQYIIHKYNHKKIFTPTILSQHILNKCVCIRIVWQYILWPVVVYRLIKPVMCVIEEKDNIYVNTYVGKWLIIESIDVLDVPPTSKLNTKFYIWVIILFMLSAKYHYAKLPNKDSYNLHSMYGCFQK